MVTWLPKLALSLIPTPETIHTHISLENLPEVLLETSDTLKIEMCIVKKSGCFQE